ncbi:MAG: AraC family transcriptional regulator [Anaerolineaceae bacterium]|nr:AraC family transcriptional regulator [Anaerolineaceae bacterium]
METNSSAITIREILYNEVCPPYNIPSHTHTVYQWYCLIFGNADFSADQEIYKLNPGDSILISPDVVRQPIYRYPSAGYFYVLFENHDLHLNKSVDKVVTVPSDVHHELLSLVHEINKPEENTYRFVESLVIRLLISIERSLKTSVPIEQQSFLNLQAQKDIVERVEAFMRRNLHRELNHKELSDEFHISTSHLARIFRNATGITLTKRLIQLRILRAKQLLLESSLPISEISLSVGYTNFSHFAKVFRQELGVSPGDYRRSQGNIRRNLAI